MAELLLNIGSFGPDPLYQDGDILCAFNDRKIHSSHAEEICHKNKVGFNSDGLRNANTLFEFFLKNSRQYKFERISNKEVKRTLLSDMSSKIFSDVPDVNGNYMNVSEYIKKRKNHPKHKIFGTNESEWWYGGKTNVDINAIWTEIEAKTGLLKADHGLWPLSETEKRVFFGISVDDFSDNSSEILTQPSFDNTNPEKSIMIKKRQRKIDWKNLQDMSAKTITDVEDKNISHDSRIQFNYLISSLVQTKT